MVEKPVLPGASATPTGSLPMLKHPQDTYLCNIAMNTGRLSTM